MNKDGHFLGLSLTVLLHIGLAAGAIASQEQCGWMGGEAKAESDRFKDARVIEAGLARKAVEPKNKLPQKQKKEKFAPPDPIKVATPNAPPVEETKETLRPKPDEIDPKSILKKNRVQEDDLSSTGTTEVPKEGQADGSDWGTEKDAKGDPYVGELKGRIYAVWQVPSLETGTGKTIGCVRLNDKGKIIESELTKKSSNANLNRSVSLALKQAPSMEDPVPGHLTELLTVQGICFEFRLEND
jgi:hypothetical protein